MPGDIHTNCKRIEYWVAEKEIKDRKKDVTYIKKHFPKTIFRKIKDVGHGGLAPMMVSGSDLYDLMSPYLKAEYFIIAPDQGGHGKAGAYISANDEYGDLKEYLQKNGYADIWPRIRKSMWKK